MSSIKRMPIAALLLSVMQAIVSTGSQAAPCGTPEGVWLHSNERIRVKIAPCAERLCGEIVWLKNPEDDSGAPRSDTKNPDITQRARTVVGIMAIRGLVRSGACVWTKGTIYNPDDGQTYNARVTMIGPSTVQVRAYLLLPLFGETLFWTRVRR